MLRLIPLPTLTTREYEQASGFPARKEEEKKTIKAKKKKINNARIRASLWISGQKRRGQENHQGQGSR
jgi:hypothetical protein